MTVQAVGSRRHIVKVTAHKTGGFLGLFRKTVYDCETVDLRAPEWHRFFLCATDIPYGWMVDHLMREHEATWDEAKHAVEQARQWPQSGHR